MMTTMMMTTMMMMLTYLNMTLMDWEMMTRMKNRLTRIKIRHQNQDLLHALDQGHPLPVLHHQGHPALAIQDPGLALDQESDPDVATPGLGQGNIDWGQRSPRSLSVLNYSFLP